MDTRHSQPSIGLSALQVHVKRLAKSASTPWLPSIPNCPRGDQHCKSTSSGCPKLTATPWLPGIPYCPSGYQHCKSMSSGWLNWLQLHGHQAFPTVHRVTSAASPCQTVAEIDCNSMATRHSQPSMRLSALQVHVKWLPKLTATPWLPGIPSCP